VFATILQISGMVVISIGVGLINIPAGICTFGIACVLTGIAIEKDKI
jgi:hypothetical protein